MPDILTDIIYGPGMMLEPTPAGPGVTRHDRVVGEGITAADVKTTGSTVTVTKGVAVHWFSGDGPPPNTIIGASIGDYYLDNISGTYYRLTPG